MNVLSISFTSESNNSIKILFDNGDESYAPWPTTNVPTNLICEQFFAANGLITAYSAPTPTEPTVVSVYQAKMALLQANLYSQVETIVNESNNLALSIAWNNAATWIKDNEFITTLQGSLGLSNNEVDALFTLAESIE